MGPQVTGEANPPPKESLAVWTGMVAAVAGLAALYRIGSDRIVWYLLYCIVHHFVFETSLKTGYGLLLVIVIGLSGVQFGE